MTAAEIPSTFPDPSNSNPGPYYMSTGSDRECGVAYGLVIGRDGDRFFVLTPAGIRYYNHPSTVEIICRGHWQFQHIHTVWTTAFSVLKVAL